MATALRVQAEVSSGVIRPLRDFVSGVAMEHGLPRRRVADLEQCVHEAVANVVCHAYGGDVGPVDVTVEERDHALTVVVSDHGDGRCSQGHTGAGMGLRLMSQLSAGCTVCASSSGMQVEMTFPLPPAGASRLATATREGELGLPLRARYLHLVDAAARG